MHSQCRAEHRAPGTVREAPPGMNRPSNHREPEGAVQIARHYIRDVVYGANDGIITTSMGVGNYLSIRSDESARAAQDLPEEEARPARHGFATFLAFFAAGAIPLVPYVLPIANGRSLAASMVLTFAALFFVGSMRALVTIDKWWWAGLEMLGLGALVAVAAYGSGAFVSWLIPGFA